MLNRRNFMVTNFAAIITLLVTMIFYDTAGLSGGNMLKDRLNDGKCKFHTSTLSEIRGLLENCFEDYGPATVIIGDSHALNIYNSYFLGSNEKFVLGLSLGGCRPYSDNAQCFYAEFRDFLIKNPQMFERIVFHQSGSHLVADRLNRVDQSLPFRPGEIYKIRKDLIALVLGYIESLKEYSEVVWLGPFIDARNEPTYYNLFFGNLDIKQKNIEIFSELEREISNAAKERNPEIKYVSLIDSLGPIQFLGRVNGCVVWRDWDHWSICGEALYSQKVAVAIESAFTD